MSNVSKSWFVKPETVRVDLDGEWIEVKRRLTVGEERKAMAALVSEVRADGRYTPNLEMVGKAEVMAYLVDWSLRGEDGKAVRIDTVGKLSAALDLLDSERFTAISQAITAHIEAMTAEREQEKNVPAGSSEPAAT